MVFPFKTKPSDDLRAIFKHQRLKEHSRDLKFSSIGPGGSLDVVDSSGNVVASLGDLPGGQGFGLRDGGTVKDIRGLFADAAGLADAESRLDSHASRLGNAEGRLDSHASRLGATENVANGVRGEVTTARGGFGSLNARLNDHVSRIGANENAISLAATALAHQIGRIDTLYTRVNTLESRQNHIWNYMVSKFPDFLS